MNRGGGEVWCPSAVRSVAEIASPCASCGSRASSPPVPLPADGAASSAYRSLSRPSSYAAMKPRKVMTVPDAANTAARPSLVRAPIFTDAVDPRASAICEATVRFQISSYSRNWSPDSSRATCAGVRNESPAGRMASCASWAPLLLEAYNRAAAGTNSGPYSSAAWRRAASIACELSTGESVRM